MGLTPEREALRETAIAMHDSGVRATEIIERLGLSQGTFYRWINPEYAERSRQRANALKLTYRKPCPKCGTPMTGCMGPNHPPSQCKTCAAEQQHTDRYWTPERLLDAAQEWQRRFGRAPKAMDWIRALTIDGYKFPAMSACYQSAGVRERRGLPGSPPWETWNEYLAAAGLDPTPVGQYKREGTVGLRHVQRSLLRGRRRRWTSFDLADERGISVVSARRILASLVRRGLFTVEDGRRVPGRPGSAPKIYVRVPR